MAPSRSPSPLKIPTLTRKLSLSPARGKASTEQTTAVSADPRRGSTNAPLPWFLKQGKADITRTYVDLEWQQRERLAEGLQVTDPPSQWARTQGLGDPLTRNRYLNIEPFLSNRIKLKVGEGINDYINASPITLGERRYISTQGPKQSSVTHFYRMIANETSTVAVIIMLTQTFEAGREKCFTYWPNEKETPTLELAADPDDTEDLFEGSVSLLSVEEDTKTRSTISHLKLKSRARKHDEAPSPDDTSWQEKDIWHLHFSAWPDFSVPEGDDRQALIDLLHLSRRYNAISPPPIAPSFPEARNGARTSRNGELNPRIVHCSAGVGRSGTFIALDHLLTRLENGELDEVPEGTDPIADTVDSLRQQRMMMVQGESQFFFLYEALKEAWVHRWRAKQV